jgi:hypothetical protein
MNIVEISEKEFEDIDCAKQIISHDNPRKFALVEIDKSHGKYGLSWRSDLIKPVIRDAPASLAIWIGVDQRLVAVSKSEGNVIVALSLDSNLVDIISNNLTTAVLTETELFLFNSDGSARLVKALPEIGSGISVTDNIFYIEMIDGETLNVDLDTLKLVNI